MKIFSIIVTYNALRKDWLDKCLNSLLSSETPTEIIIVDNASTDNTRAFINNNYPQLTLINSRKNLGFGKGNNLGISEALRMGADYVFLLNQDTIVKENTITLLLDAAIKNKEFAILSPIHLNYEGTDLEFYFAAFMFRNNAPQFYFDHVLNLKKEVYETKFVNAAAWFIPAKIFYQIGAFDPIFKHYGEDDNYCQRVQYHHYKVGVVTNCFINHDSMERITLENYQYSSRYFDDYVKHLQVTNANINIDIKNRYKFEKNTLIFNTVISFIKLNFKEMKSNVKKILMLKSTFDEIYESRQINSSFGKHYIDG